MGQTKHLTYDKSRHRYVFQIRVPKDVASSFNERSHVRIALGRIDETEANDRARELALAWTDKFEKATRRRTPSRILKNASSTVLVLTDELLAQAVATRRLIVLTRLYQTLSDLRRADDAAWDAAVVQGEMSLRAERRKLTRGAADGIPQVLQDIEAAFSIKLDVSGIDLVAFSELVNADAVSVAKGWLATLCGEATLDQLRPEQADLLPLTRFYGTAANKLIDTWRARLELLGKSARPKTVAKYQAIVDDLAAIVGETPVESIRPEHVRQLSATWRERGNSVATIADKWTILISLLRPIALSAAELCRSMMPRTNLERTKRLPFTAPQLGRVRTAVATDESTTHDDLMLCDLETLTGARLGEVLQLRTSDVKNNGNFWTISIGGCFDAKLKTVTSRRVVPVSTRNNPELHVWMETRTSGVRRDELLFADAKPDKFDHYGAAESKRLNGVIRALFDDKRLVFESIRNTVARTLRAEGVDPRVRRGLLGHADLDIHEKHYDPEGLLTVEDLMPAVPALEGLAAKVRAACTAASPT